MTLTSLSLLVSCASLKPEPPQRRPASMSPQVTIETSGDLYPTDDGSQIQLDFFGACHTESRNIIINIKDEQASVPCENGHYKYSHHFSKTVFNSNKRKYQLSVLKAFHKGAEEKGASSWVLMDLNDKRVKTVLNRQTRYEKIPTGELEPVTEFSAFGTCTDGSKITIDVTGKDRYGHRISRYDDKKSCKNSGFYFLSQIDGLANRKMRFHIYKTAPSEKPLKRRGVASAEPTPKYRFQYSIPMYE